MFPIRFSKCVCAPASSSQLTHKQTRIRRKICRESMSNERGLLNYARYSIIYSTIVLLFQQTGSIMLAHVERYAWALETRKRLSDWKIEFSSSCCGEDCVGLSCFHIQTMLLSHSYVCESVYVMCVIVATKIQEIEVTHVWKARRPLKQRCDDSIARPLRCTRVILFGKLLDIRAYVPLWMKHRAHSHCHVYECRWMR